MNTPNGLPIQEQVDIVNVAINDVLATDQIEKILINGLEEIREALGALSPSKDDGEHDDEGEDDDQEDDDQVGHAHNFEPLKTRIENGLNNIVIDKMRGALCDDPEILLSAKHYKIEPESRFKVLNTSRVEFYIQPERFDAWLLKHQRPTSTNFVLAKKYDYKVDNQCRLSYECQCTGKKRIRKDRVQGGVTGKTRNRAPGIKQGCGAKIFATRAREHIETRNSRGFEGLFIWQTGSDTLLVESFTTKGLLMRSKLTFQDLPLGISCRAPVTISS